MIHTSFAFLKRTILSARTLLVILAVPLIVLLERLADIAEVLEEGSYSGFCMFVVQLGLESRGMLLLFPLLCALPGASALIEDCRCGITRMLLVRTTRGKYIAARCISCGLSGGIALTAGVVLSCLLSLMILGSMEPAAGMRELPDYMKHIARLAGMYFLSGIFWSLFGMLMSIITGSRYVAALSPFSAYYLMSMLRQRYFRQTGLLDPRAWIVPEKYNIWDRTAMVAGLVLCLIFVMFFVVYHAAGRSLKDV